MSARDDFRELAWWASAPPGHSALRDEATEALDEIDSLRGALQAEHALADQRLDVIRDAVGRERRLEEQVTFLRDQREAEQRYAEHRENRAVDL